MTYRCAFGHTSYHASCDACDGATTSTETGWANDSAKDEITFKAALRGMTYREYLEQEEED